MVIAGSLILITIFLFGGDVSREALATNPHTDVLFGRRQNNEDADQYFYLYHKLRLCSATDLDDILV